jgi:hypothetical protein
MTKDYVDASQITRISDEEKVNEKVSIPKYTYKILRAGGVHEIEEDTQQHLDRYWSLAGNLICTPDGVFMQPVVLQSFETVTAEEYEKRKEALKYDTVLKN